MNRNRRPYIVFVHGSYPFHGTLVPFVLVISRKAASELFAAGCFLVYDPYTDPSATALAWGLLIGL